MWSYWNFVILRPPKVEIHRSTVYHLRIVLKWAHGSVQNYLANIMSACIKLLSIEEAWRLEIVKGRSYKLNMMAFANKIQSQTQLSLKLLIFWVRTSVGHADGCGYRRKHVDIRIIRNRMVNPSSYLDQIKTQLCTVLDHSKDPFNERPEENTFLTSLGELRTIM